MYNTDAHLYNSSVNIESISFSHLLTHNNLTIYWDATQQALILHLTVFKCFKCLKFNMYDKRAVLIRLKIKTICLLKKLFWLQKKLKQICLTKKLFWLEKKLKQLAGSFYDLYLPHSSNVSNISYSTKHLYICYDLLMQKHLYSQLLPFYAHYCHVWL